MEKYIARYGKVFQKKGTNKPLQNVLELKKGESINDYTQVPKPETKSDNKVEAAKTGGSKNVN